VTRRLDELGGALRQLLQAEGMSDSMFAMVNSRLILRTGVNLKAVTPDQAASRETYQRVMTALQDMGFYLDE